MRRIWILKAALVAVMIVSLALPSWAKSPKMKMTTPVPPGIESPDTAAAEKADKEVALKKAISD